MLKLSWSKLNTYIRCPKKYYESYVLGHWGPKSQALLFGIAFHEAMEYLMKHWESPASDELLGNAETVFDQTYTFGRVNGDSYDTAKYIENPGPWVRVGSRMIRAIARSIASRDFEVIPDGVEQWCNKPGFSGKIDCKAIVDGKRTLIDWKTASWEFTDDRVANDKQLTCYGWMTPGEWDQMAFVVVMKTDYSVHWHITTRTPKQIAELETFITDMRETIEQDKTFKGKHTRKACMAYNRKCEQWEMGYCEGLDDF